MFSFLRRLSAAVLVLVAIFGPAAALAAPLAERLRPERLRATREAVERLARERRPVELAWPGGLRDVRALIHVHSSLSYDSRGSLDEIVAGARLVGAQVVMFAEHPAGERVDGIVVRRVDFCRGSTSLDQREFMGPTRRRRPRFRPWPLSTFF